jgi:hypothetical protein
MYQASAAFRKHPQNTRAKFDKTQAHCEAKDRSAGDTRSACSRHVPAQPADYIATDTAKGAVARLAGIEIPEIRGRRADHRGAEGAHREDRHFSERAGGEDRRFGGQGYRDEGRRQGRGDQRALSKCSATPTRTLFHRTTAYNILRHNGIGRQARLWDSVL